MLMVPYIHKGPLDARHVGIAWDGGRLAARALRDALPFLTAAQAVTVIAVNEERGDIGGRSSDQLVSHLARRGIKARIERLTADRGNVHEHHPVDRRRQQYRPAGDGRFRSFAIAGANSRRRHAGHVRVDDGAGADVALSDAAAGDADRLMCLNAGAAVGR